MAISRSGSWSVLLLGAVALVCCPGCPAAHSAAETKSASKTPASPDEDLDNDGIPDIRDRCPNIPEDCDGFEDTDGCPEPDNDGDGIPDVCDLCPNVPETKNGHEDADGCPEPRALAPSAGDPTVQFEWRSSRIEGASAKALEEVAAALKKAPELERIAVVGHAARDEPNRERLSEERAKKALSALTALGIDEARLEAHGASDREPLVPINDPAYPKNRRISFVLLRGHGKELRRWGKSALEPVAVPIGQGCPGGYAFEPKTPLPCR